MLFVKAAKVVAIGIVFFPITGCAIATGIIFASLLKSVSYAPDYEEVLFNYAILGFAFIETFVFMTFAGVGVVLVF
jgi:F0F1-type ATP synthase membrane subunit c/vacuolar-type H+-ATPase subunit K